MAESASPGGLPMFADPLLSLLSPLSHSARVQLLSKWSGMIIGIQGKQTGEFMYQIKIDIPKTYPQDPPVVRFIAPRIKMACVDERGIVDISKLDPAFQWAPTKSIADVLMAIRTNMEVGAALRSL